ncbi:MAG: helix-turn-helix domain-containing protein [Theionarchaea archaeon]|nr:helix-turn-helix domain-containing protein [Theionarchaea archaeon]MBU7038414.1 helix-turn-helix domain-containing protein [Theionarchaea archaeon]
MISSEQLLDVLGNETRRMILELLAEKPRYTTEIASLLNIGQKAINDHLKIMSDFGIIETYVQKQQRGSPRKYFQVNERFKLEFTLTPGLFRIYVLEPRSDWKFILEEFPEFKELQKEVEQIQKLRQIEQHRKVCRDLVQELDRLTQAKMYIENLLARTRKRCMMIIDSLDLPPVESRVLFEVVTGKEGLTVEGIAEKCKISTEETVQALQNLEQKGVVRL